jgi:hypothetical protein
MGWDGSDGMGPVRSGLTSWRSPGDAMGGGEAQEQQKKRKEKREKRREKREKRK